MNEKDYVPVSLQGNGTTKEIAYQWKTFDKTDLIVELESITSGELTTLELGSDYDVNVEAIGGNIILTTAPTSDYFIKVSRKTPNYQSKGFSTSPGFQGSEIEKSFDVSKTSRFIFDGKFSNLNIKTWNEDKIEIDVRMIVLSDSKIDKSKFDDVFDVNIYISIR